MCVFMHGYGGQGPIQDVEKGVPNQGCLEKFEMWKR